MPNRARNARTWHAPNLQPLQPRYQGELCDFVRNPSLPHRSLCPKPGKESPANMHHLLCTAETARKGSTPVSTKTKCVQMC